MGVTNEWHRLVLSACPAGMLVGGDVSERPSALPSAVSWRRVLVLFWCHNSVVSTEPAGGSRPDRGHSRGV